MSSKIQELQHLLDSCSDKEKDEIRSFIQIAVPHGLEREWGIDGDTILSAIERSTDLTKRGVRGIIAEAVFERDQLPKANARGWTAEKIDGDLAYDALLRAGAKTARIQIKLQRLEKGVPKIFYEKHYEKGFYVVEVQKTRSGEKVTTTEVAGTEKKVKATTGTTESTRPYKFTDFDVLAVNMHPSSRDWKEFRFTLSRWLLPRDTKPALIEIMQPVPAAPNPAWTGDLIECLEWLDMTETRSTLPELKHKLSKKKQSRKAKKNGAKKKSPKFLSSPPTP